MNLVEILTLLSVVCPDLDSAFYGYAAWERLEEAGLIKRGGDGNHWTPKGKAYIQLLKDTPLPVVGFFDSRNEQLIRV